MREAWAVISSSHPGQAFLAMCIERSLDKGLRVYVTYFSDDSASKILRNLVSIHSVGHVQIFSLYVKLDVAPVKPFGPWAQGLSPATCHEEEVMQLLGKLDCSALNTLDIRYHDTFDSNNDEDEQEDQFGNGVGSDFFLLDHSGSEHNNRAYDASDRSA